MTRLIVISSEVDVENEISLVNELFHQGLELFHLRKPHWTIDDQRRFLQKMDFDFLSKISVHQHYETVIEYSLKYYHVKENDRKIISLTDAQSNQQNGTELTSLQRTLRSLNKTLQNTKKSTSFHNYNELQFESIFWDYCFLSPVFDSISKPEYKSHFKYDFNIEGDLNQRVFALGGINKNNIEQVFEKEFYGAAVLGGIWHKPENVINNFKELQALCKQNVHTH
ncbi:MAG: thiamine phosphate synthase [Bacteroidetes bacterium]|nr:thiamine phosphate synthase [Bacteroidota bacterium]